MSGNKKTQFKTEGTDKEKGKSGYKQSLNAGSLQEAYSVISRLENESDMLSDKFTNIKTDHMRTLECYDKVKEYISALKPLFFSSSA